MGFFLAGDRIFDEEKLSLLLEEFTEWFNDDLELLMESHGLILIDGKWVLEELNLAVSIDFQSYKKEYLI
jgi:hypothetical protein